MEDTWNSNNLQVDMRMGNRDFFRGLEILWSMKSDKTQDFMNLANLIDQMG